MLHRCDTRDKENESATPPQDDANCLDKLEGAYAVGRVLGHGATGLVLYVSTKDPTAPVQSFAVKLVPRNAQSEREIDVACRVDRELATGH
jgi:hypothetical protein